MILSCMTQTSAAHVLRRGYNMGVRLIDEFLAKTKTIKCGDFRETAERIAKVLVDG